MGKDFVKNFFLFLVFILLVVSTGFGKKGKELDTISDLYIDHLFLSPEIPWGRDAFRKKSGIVPVNRKEQELFLQAIIYNRYNATAIINDEPVSIGDEVADRRVVEIGPKSVVLGREDSLIEVFLPVEEVSSSGEIGGGTQ